MAKKIKRPIRPLLQLKRVEKHIAENKHMSGLISNLYNEQSGKLDYSWKDGYSTGVKDTEGLYKPQIKEKDAKLLEQAVKHQKSITKLKSELEAKESTNQIAMVQGETLNRLLSSKLETRVEMDFHMVICINWIYPVIRYSTRIIAVTSWLNTATNYGLIGCHGLRFPLC
ncbi:hypothetical protein ACFSHO_03500 [Acinetobacter vivianii]